MCKALSLLALLCLLVSNVAFAQTPTPVPITIEELESQLHYLQGNIVLKDGLATLNVPPQFRYLTPENTERLLVDGWGNPPGNETLGMVLPADISPFTDEGWGAIITYFEDGHVADDDADSINYDDLLQHMKQAAADKNADRIKQGYPTVTLIGWAESPHYDRATHKLYWAEELAFDADSDNVLNYRVRILGRSGVIDLNAVGSMSQLADIKSGMKSILGFVNFESGQRYQDFITGEDKLADYGITALILGSAAAKAGLFKGLLAALIALKKVILVALVAAAAYLRKRFTRKPSSNTLIEEH